MPIQNYLCILLWLILMNYGNIISAQSNDNYCDTLLIHKHNTQIKRYVKTNQIDSAAYHIKQFILLLENCKNWKEWYRQYKLLFKLYRRENRPQAFVILKEALNKEKQLAIPIYFIAKIKALLAMLYQSQSDYTKSIRFYEKALPIMESNQDMMASCTIYGNLGRMYWNKGDDFKAIKYLKKAINLAIQLNSSNRIVGYRRWLAEAYRTSKQWDKMINIYKNIMNQNPENSDFYISLSKAYEANHDLDNAKITVQQALKFIPKDNTMGLSDTYHQFGRIAHAQKQYSQALTHYQTAYNYALNSYGKTHIDCAKIPIFIADTYLAQQNYPQALTYCQQTLTHLIPNFKEKKVTKNPTLSQLPPTNLWVMEALGKKGQTYHAQYHQTHQKSDLHHAYNAYQLVTNYIQQIKANYSEEESQWLLTSYTYNIYEQAIQTALALWNTNHDSKYQQQAFQWMQQNKAFGLRSHLKEKKALELVGISTTERDSAQQLQLSIASLQKEIYDIQQGESGNIDSLNEVNFGLKRKQEDLQAAWKTNYPKYTQYKNDLRLATIPELQQNIDSTTALIEYFVGDSSIYTCVITTDKVHFYALPIPETFDTTFQQFRKSVSDWQFIEKNMDQAAQFYLTSAHQLYQWLLAEPLQRLPKSIKRLLIIPDGVLGYVSFDALLTKPFDDWQSHHSPYLVKKYAIWYAYSSTLVVPSANQSATFTPTVGGFGLAYDVYTLEDLAKNTNPKPSETVRPAVPVGWLATIARDYTLAKLPHAPKEVHFVVNLFGGKKWVNQAATKENFLTHASDYGILHLAMHGILDDENPLYSALVFSKSADTLDNFLYASDMYQTNLQAGLAVLSACNTGNGQLVKGEGVMSLSRAFSFAGCPSTVMSLWSIPDQATNQVVQSFYQQLQKEEPKDKALQQAKLNYLKQSSPNYRLPIYWAALVGIGDRQVIINKTIVKYDPQSPKPFLWFLLMSMVLLMGLASYLWRKKR